MAETQDEVSHLNISEVKSHLVLSACQCTLENESQQSGTILA